jgi:hypothetical protein
MAYTAEKPRTAPDTNELRNRIPGWGVDLDPKDRPAVPKEKFNPGGTGAHWDFPERQVERWPREKSPEHKFLTPVFGTACPPKGISGAIRRYAYKFSEGRLAHWLLLVGADRVDVIESRVQGLLSGRPDNPITEAGLPSEMKYHGIRSRLGQRRADLKHQPLDLIIAGSGALIAVYALTRAITKNGRAHRRAKRSLL